MWPDFGGTLKLSSMSGRVLVLYTGLFGICTLDLVGSTISSSVVQPVDPALKAAVSDEVFVFPSMKMDILSLVSKDILFGNRWIKHFWCLNLWSMICFLALFISTYIHCWNIFDIFNYLTLSSLSWLAIFFIFPLRVVKVCSTGI